MSEKENEETSTFAVVVTPEFKNGEWTGVVVCHMEEEVKDDLGTEDVVKIRSVCGMMASCIVLMEKDPDFYEYVSNFFLANFENAIEEMIEDLEEPKFTRSEDGKVITLHTNTKTYGNA